MDSAGVRLVAAEDSAQAKESARLAAGARLKLQVRGLIGDNFLFPHTTEIREDESFLDAGILDSTGIPILIALLEENYGIEVNDAELTADNLDSIEKVSAYLERKLDGPQGK